ncbi:Dual specificity protein phosphatase 23 [Triplophysa tibetana]|uniref:Dual specificity protein phosphatase 23 n=1 Tax=Triplophysa tibetana TaxID=1572043 RepID=A0A5A9NTK3_9TELE|nr:Dual specificity protein phosphatase 23 [Triplophysa tibetana]
MAAQLTHRSIGPKRPHAATRSHSSTNIYLLYVLRRFFNRSTTVLVQYVLHFRFSLRKSLKLMASAPPPNFSWVDAGKVAGMAMPRMTAHYQYLLNNGIKHLVSLSERKPPYHDTCPDLTLHHIKIHDFCAPTFDQIKRFLCVVEEANAKGQGVAVHCMHGLGRTGTMLACYLVKTRKISGIDAINEIRSIRRGSIETREQEQTVVQFYQQNKV